MKVFAATDIGQRRTVNQDSVFASLEPVGNLPNLFIAADGMGGHNAGDFASRYAVSSIVESVRNNPEANPVRVIREAIEEANTGILREAAAHEEMLGMGTTVVVTSIVDGVGYTANIGDSRLYVYDGGTLRQVTKDHSLVEEMVRLGEISEEDARTHPDKNIITRALGAAPEVETDFFEYPAPAEGFLLMCTDGLTNMVEDENIRSILSGEGTPEELGWELIRQANANGGRDNIGVVLIRPDEDEEAVC